MESEHFMPRAFVTGVAGFLGSHVAQRFHERGWDVVGIDNLAGGSLANVPDGVRFEAIDCLDRASYVDLVRGSDLVYHCAASAYDGLSVFSPARIFRDTVQATVEVASAAIDGGVGRFVHCSSMARYGDQVAPFSEDMKPAPVSPYGVAKWSSELLVENLFQIHGGEYSIAIPHNIIGPRQRFDDPYRNVAAIMINRISRGLQPLIYGDGSQRRSFSFVNDVLFCLEKMGTAPEAAGQIINVGPDESSITVLELAQEIAHLFDFKLDPIFISARPTEVADATCNSEKARRLLNYRTSTGLREGLEAMIEWHRLHPSANFRYDVELEIHSEKTPRSWVERLI
jgi:UDP-glucose 4-epimerase